LEEGRLGVLVLMVMFFIVVGGYLVFTKEGCFMERFLRLGFIVGLI